MKTPNFSHGRIIEENPLIADIEEVQNSSFYFFNCRLLISMIKNLIVHCYVKIKHCQGTVLSNELLLT